MGLTTTWFATYLSGGVSYQGPDFHSHKFIQAIKGNKLNGYAWVPCRGISRQLENKNLADAGIWFAQMAADFLLQKEKISTSASYALIPIPSSEAVVGCSFERFPARVLAERLQTELTRLGARYVHVADVLRWSERVPSAHKEGGPRDPVDLYPRTTTINRELVAPWDDLVLIDDVCSSGGRLRTFAARIKKDLNQDIWRALVAGRTVYNNSANPFEPESTVLEDFSP